MFVGSIFKHFLRMTRPDPCSNLEHIIDLQCCSHPSELSSPNAFHTHHICKCSNSLSSSCPLCATCYLPYMYEFGCSHDHSQSAWTSRSSSTDSPACTHRVHTLVCVFDSIARIYRLQETRRLHSGNIHTTARTFDAHSLCSDTRS